MATIADRLKECAAALVKIAEEIECGETPPQTAAPPTLDKVRSVLVSLSRSGKTAEVKAILTKHGANKLSEVKPEDYAAVLKEADSIGN